MRIRRARLVAAFLLLAVLGLWLAGYAYQNFCHTRIAFAGGSITFQGANKEGYIGVVRSDFYKRGRGDIKTLYFGVNGERSVDVLRDLPGIFAMKPRLVVVLVGANDVLGYYSLLHNGNPINAYEATLRTIIRKIRKRGAEVIICSPVIVGERDYSKPSPDPSADAATQLMKTPRGEGFSPIRVDKEVGVYAESARDVARSEGVAYCDLRKAFKDYLATHNPDNKLEGILTYDGLHPNAKGHEIIAMTLLPVLRDARSIKEEPLLRKLLRPFTNKGNPVFWKILSKFDKRIK